MPGGYRSKTGAADINGALLHQKKQVCMQCRSTLAHSLQVVEDPFSMHVHLFPYFYYLFQYYLITMLNNMNYMTIECPNVS